MVGTFVVVVVVVVVVVCCADRLMRQVLKIVSERTVRNTGPSTWLRAWQQELDDFPEE